MLKTGSNYTMSTNPALEKIENPNRTRQATTLPFAGKANGFHAIFFSAPESPPRGRSSYEEVTTGQQGEGGNCKRKKKVGAVFIRTKKSHQTDLKDLFKCGEKGLGN